MMLHTKYQGSRSYGFRNSDKKIFHVFPILYNNFYVNCVTPGLGPFLAPLAYFDQALGDATKQTSRLYALWFQTRRFFMIYPI